MVTESPVSSFRKPLKKRLVSPNAGFRSEFLRLENVNGSEGYFPLRSLPTVWNLCPQINPGAAKPHPTAAKLKEHPLSLRGMSLRQTGGQRGIKVQSKVIAAQKTLQVMMEIKPEPSPVTSQVRSQEIACSIVGFATNLTFPCAPSKSTYKLIRCHSSVTFAKSLFLVHGFYKDT
ncbi:unnamed protein product [Allacma fusca]|uniref:Uncharacterized protein n=1 Tax=Allacma fusca TaxID=39272 RepID=A0A8J2PH54_9HEXA|nr:unnamed protein product [Allacma fusca]